MMRPSCRRARRGTWPSWSIYLYLEDDSGNQRDATRVRLDNEAEAVSYALSRLTWLQVAEADRLGGDGAWCYVAKVCGPGQLPQYAYLFSPFEPVEWDPSE